MLQEQSIFLKAQSIPIIKQNLILKEKERKDQESVELLESIEQGVIERIRRSSPSLDLELLRKEAVGEDTRKNVKRFYLCSSRMASGFYQAEFYLADYLTGEIYNLNKNVPNVIIALSAAEVEEADYQVWIEDLDGNGLEDILVVWMSEEKYLSQGIYLWMQKGGEFLPVNREYCGNNMEKGENDFSKQIKKLEEILLEKQKLEKQQIDELVKWIKAEVSLLLYPPQGSIPYRERRMAEDIHVSVIMDRNGQYQVSIPEILYSEKKINNWLLEFYQKEEKEKEEFLGIGIEESDIYLTEAERIKERFFYETSLQIERVDDAVISIFGNTSTYSGGAHGNDFSFSVNFDTKSGEILALEELVLDLDTFRNQAVDYIAQNYADYPEWWMGYVRKAIWEERWYLTEDGIVFFLNSINGSGIYFYEIPYEYFADGMEEEYLPGF